MKGHVLSFNCVLLFVDVLLIDKLGSLSDIERGESNTKNSEFFLNWYYLKCLWYVFRLII